MQDSAAGWVWAEQLRSLNWSDSNGVIGLLSIILKCPPRYLSIILMTGCNTCN